MKGFKKEIRSKVTAFESQLMITPADDTTEGDTEVSSYIRPVILSDSLKNIITTTLPGCEVTSSISYPGALKTTDNFSGVIFKGNAHRTLTEMIESSIVDGRMPDFGQDANALVLSAHTASRLNLKAGDKVGAYFFNDGSVKARNLRVAAIFDTHFSDYDANMAVAGAGMLNRVAGMPAGGSSRIDVNGIVSDDAIDDAARKLQNRLLNAYYTGEVSEIYRVDNVHRRGALYFNWLELLDTNVAVILALMAAVAAFTLISSLFIIILEKVNMIGILKAIGASNSLVRRVFILVAERLVARGLVIGNVIGLTLIWLENRFRFLPLDPETYYLSHVPVSIGAADVIWLNAAVIVVAALVLVLPSHIVATISPARSIRYD